MSFPTLNTNRLLLREITPLDLDNIYKGLSNPLVVQHYAVSFKSLEAAKEQMKWFEDDRQLWWAICSKNDTVFHGAGGLNDIKPTTHTAEIGLWLLPEYWGQGIMKEALPIIASYGLNHLGLQRIEGFVESDNINCKKAMSQLDFVLEKTIPNYEIKNGKAISIEVYVKTKMQ